MRFFSGGCWGFPVGWGCVLGKRCAFKLCFQMCHAGGDVTAACGHSCHACLLLECMAFLLLGIPDHRRNTERERVWNGGFHKVLRPLARAENRPAPNPLSLLVNCLLSTFLISDSTPNPLSFFVNCLFFIFYHSARLG